MCKIKHELQTQGAREGEMRERIAFYFAPKQADTGKDPMEGQSASASESSRKLGKPVRPNCLVPSLKRTLYRISQHA